MTINKPDTQHIWAVTRSINQYDQDGDYFVGFFYEKPTAAQLANLTGRSVEYWEESPNGGRHGREYEWYYVVRINEGVEYEEQ
jgi:hypothetical protein